MFEEQGSKICKYEQKILFKSICIILIVFLFILTIYVFVGIQNKVKEGRYIGQGIENRNTITVSGKGEIYAKPDLAFVTFSVITEKKEVAEAMKENTEKINAIINSIREQEVEEKDLKTTGFNIYPRYEWQEKTQFYPSGRRVLVGYEIKQSLEVKIRDMEKIGIIIQKATDAGANQVGDLRLTIDNEDEIKKQARGQAIEMAKDKAGELASQLDVKLVRIVNFSETGIVPRYYAFEETVGMGEGQALQIEAGENKIEVRVSITYEIN
ncbi:DUF541 domain-containing protein [Candidatus Atribacteria bacterium MT.SAG.1]|nr:DUF541 domain-containing protein [Candidatus Atribacteria bacterium MT.SAG.1]